MKATQSNRPLNRRVFLRSALLGSLGAPFILSGTWSQAAVNAKGKTVAAPRGGQPFRGMFPIMPTPFLENGEIDLDSIRKEVNFIIASVAKGMAWPQLASEFYVMSDDERRATAEVIVSEAGGRLPVVIGVQSTNYWKVALSFAKHAESIGADGIISLPPYPANATVEAASLYFETLAETVDLPIFIQNTGGRWGTSMPVEKVVELGRKFPQVFYIKEEGTEG